MNSESRSPDQNSDPTQITLNSLNMAEMLLGMMVLTEMHSESFALRKAEAMSNLSVTNPCSQECEPAVHSSHNEP